MPKFELSVFGSWTLKKFASKRKLELWSDQQFVGAIKLYNVIARGTHYSGKIEVSTNLDLPNFFQKHRHSYIKRNYTDNGKYTEERTPVYISPNVFIYE